MKSKLIEYGLILGCFVVTLMFLRSNWIKEGVRQAEDRMRDSIRVDTLKIVPEAITVERMRLVPKIVVIRDTVFGEVQPPTAKLEYRFDTTQTARIQIYVDEVNRMDSTRIRTSGVIRTYPKISLENLRIYPEPITITTETHGTIYEKPVPAELYNFWTAGIFSARGMGLSIGFAQYGVGYKYNFDDTGEFFGIVQIRF